MAFAAKLTPDGTALTYLTYLGASNSQGSGISVDAQGNAWITGTVSSSDLPVTTGALQTTIKGPENAFVLKLNPAGSGVLFATYLG
jgi:sugar lactone lactonase YvrE